MSKTVILSTARTPFGKMGGGLAPLGAPELGGTAITEALERAAVEPDQVETVIYGQVLQAGQGQIPSRQAQIKGGIPKEVPSETVNKVCASGMRTVGLADQAIRAGDLNVGVAGGMESMSQAPYLLPGARFGFRMGDVTAVDAMTHDGLTNPFTEKQMINEASEVSNELEITRADMDRFAERSHRLAQAATDEGRLADEIVSVTVKGRKGDTVVETDEAIRPDTTIETLSKLKAVGGDDATHTAGNAPGVNDGAAAIVVASDEWASENGKTPLATVVSYGQVADDFPYLAKTPALAAKQALEKIGKSARGRRPLGDQRGLRLGRHQLGSHARRRRGQGQRERRRHRPRPPDRRLGRPHHRRARPRARAPRRRARSGGDLLGRRAGRRDRARGQRLLACPMTSGTSPGSQSAGLPSSTSTRRSWRGRRGWCSRASRATTGWSRAGSLRGGGWTTSATGCAGRRTSRPTRC